MAETIKATIQLRRATEEKWNEIGSTFTPKEGEPCLTLDGENAGKVKYGDGINTWSNLSYSSGSGGEASEDGGFYTPEVTQPSDDTMRISFAASKGNMPPVEPVSVTLPAGPAGKDGEDGAPGLPGKDGYSPTVQTDPIEGGTRVTITDATGPKEFEVMNGTNGQDGQPGQDGTPGQDGFSPIANVTQTADGAKITITDKSGTTNATITNGKDGTNGTDGQTPNITPGNIETLPAGSNVTASITGQTPNLTLNLGIPQGPAGAGVPSTDGVPTDYLLSPAGWVVPPSVRPYRVISDITISEDVDRIDINQDSGGSAFELNDIRLFTSTQSYDESTDQFTVLMNGYWLSKDPYIGPTHSSPVASAGYQQNNEFIAYMQNGSAQIFQPWTPYSEDNSRCGTVWSVGDKYQSIQSVSCVGKFKSGSRFVLIGR